MPKTDTDVKTLSFDDKDVVSMEGHMSLNQKRKYTEEFKTKTEASKLKREKDMINNTPFDHGRGLNKHQIRNIKNPVKRTKLERNEQLAHSSAMDAYYASELLLPSEEGTLEAYGTTKTHHLTQKDILSQVTEGVKKKAFALDLPDRGPYYCDYSRNGRHLLLAGRKGHIALFDWHKKSLSTEFQVEETIRDVKILHNYELYAVAQKRYLYIYDNAGVQIHRLKDHLETTRLEYLPYHFLLATVSKLGILRYIDTSTGENICTYLTKLGECNAMAQNKTNAIIHLGHHNGSVTLWSPNSGKPLVRMLCNQGTINALDVDSSGNYMATSGTDGKTNIWDIRMYKQLYSYSTPRPVTSMNFSSTGLLALGCGPHVQVWKDVMMSQQQYPYIYERFPGEEVSDVVFCPYEDILGTGRTSGFKSLIIPGAGEANFDTFEDNPFETTKQRANKTVRSLLEKLKPDMISLKSVIMKPLGIKDSNENKEDLESLLKEKYKVVVDIDRKRMKGRNTAAKQLARKKYDKIQLQHEQRLGKASAEQTELREKKDKQAEFVKQTFDNTTYSALNRFKE